MVGGEVLSRARSSSPEFGLAAPQDPPQTPALPRACSGVATTGDEGLVEPVHDEDAVAERALFERDGPADTAGGLLVAVEVYCDHCPVHCEVKVRQGRPIVAESGLEDIEREVPVVEQAEFRASAPEGPDHGDYPPCQTLGVDALNAGNKVNDSAAVSLDFGERSAGREKHVKPVASAKRRVEEVAIMEALLDV